MTDEIAGFASPLPERYRYAVVSALRQTCEAGVRYGYMTRNPAKLSGKNPQPPPRGVRVFTAAEMKAITAELAATGAAAVALRRGDRAAARRVGVTSSGGTSTEARRVLHGARHEDGPLTA